MQAGGVASRDIAQSEGRVGGQEGTLLKVLNLSVRFPAAGHPVDAVRSVSFSVGSGETVAIIGESGSGKSVTARAIMGLLPLIDRRVEIDGNIFFDGEDILTFSEKRFRQVRGNDVAYVPQDPTRSLNPTMRIGKQVVESLRRYEHLSRKESDERAIDLLARVHFSRPEQRIRDYPHQLSGGMRQRVAIAMAIARHPRILIADEATTALDVTTQAQILALLKDLQDEEHMSLVLISHDMGVAASYSHRVLVMYAGRIVEEATTLSLFEGARMPYTKALLDSIPRMDRPPHEKLAVVEGAPPDVSGGSLGCAFAPRCPSVRPPCRTEIPPLESDDQGRRWACLFPLPNEEAPGDGA